MNLYLKRKNNIQLYELKEDILKIKAYKEKYLVLKEASLNLSWSQYTKEGLNIENALNQDLIYGDLLPFEINYPLESNQYFQNLINLYLNCYTKFGPLIYFENQESYLSSQPLLTFPNQSSQLKEKMIEIKALALTKPLLNLELFMQQRFDLMDEKAIIEILKLYNISLKEENVLAENIDKNLTLKTSRKLKNYFN